jgi:hypothetical protein
VDGAKAGFKDLGDYLKTAATGLIEPFKCTSNLFECLSDSRYGIEKNERTIKIKYGDLIRISRGSDAAYAYSLASNAIDQVELLASIPGIKVSKVARPSLLKNYSPTLRRKIIEGFIIKKMNDKYTYQMLIKEFSYAAIKKSASDPQDLFNNALEITQNIPQDFWKSMTDGTVAATAAGDGLDTLVQVASAEGSVFLNSALLVSQSVNVGARYSASETAHNKPSILIIAGLKNSFSSSRQPIATKPVTQSPLSSEYVEKTKQEIRNRLEMWDAESCQGICQLSRSFSICRSVKDIDEKTGGLITGRRQRTNYESVQIGSEDLKLMKLISSQCKPFTEELPPALSANIKKKEGAFAPSCQSLPTIRQELGLERFGGEHYKNNCLNSASKPIATKPNTRSPQIPSKCSTVIAQSKSALSNLTRFDISKLSKYDGIPPKGRTQHLVIISSSIQESIQLKMAKTIITSCPKIGSVRFVVNGTDDQSVYGLFNDKVQIFKCTGMENPNKWGEYACS